MKIFNCKFQEAELALDEAVRLCPSFERKIRRQLYKYLVPVKLFIGKIPAEGLIEKL
jgi:hypothetical protein